MDMLNKGEHYISQAVIKIFWLTYIASTINIVKSTFTNNYASGQGGAIYLTSFNSVKISQGSTFSKNQAKLEGSDLYATKSE